MAITPKESQLTFILSGASSVVYADEIQYAFVTEPFDRIEFSNEKLRSATTTTGASPIIVNNWTGQRVQMGTICTADEPRPLTPDDANVDNIKRRWNIDRFTISGGVSLATQLDDITTIAIAHQKLLAKFNQHIAKGSMDISYTALKAMQLISLNYLSTTGLTVTGPALGTANNVLIASWNTDVAYEVLLPGGSSLVLQKWSAVLEVRSEVAASSTA